VRLELLAQFAGKFEIVDDLLLGHVDNHSRSLVNAVNFGSKPLEPPPLDETGKPSGGPANRRSEPWSNMKKVLEAGRFSLPDDDALQADLVSTGYKHTSGSAKNTRQQSGETKKKNLVMWRAASRRWRISKRGGSL
jgi:hypothetical protein